MKTTGVAVGFFAGMLITVAATVTWAQNAEKLVGQHWKAGAVKNTMNAEVASAAKKAASGSGGKFLVTAPTHALILGSRIKSAPEYHDYDTHVFVVLDGGGSFQVGGELVDRKQPAPGQATGSSIRGGDTFDVAAGDVLYVPKQTPHMWHLREGQHVNYIAVNVTDK